MRRCGSAGLGASMLLMAWSPPLGRALGDVGSTTPAALVLAVGAFWAADFFINALQGVRLINFSINALQGARLINFFVLLFLKAPRELSSSTWRRQASTRSATDSSASGTRSARSRRARSESAEIGFRSRLISALFGSFQGFLVGSFELAEALPSLRDEAGRLDSHAGVGLKVSVRAMNPT